MTYLKKSLLFIGLVAFAITSQAQLSKSFYYKGTVIARSPNYFEKSAYNDITYTAGMRRNGLIPYTLVSAMDENGKLIWHQTISHPDPSFTISTGVTDIKATETNLYVSSFFFDPGPGSTINVYKFDLEGNVLDSLMISKPLGLDRFKSELDFDAAGNLFFIVRDSDDHIYFIRINPTTMTLISEDKIDDNDFNPSLPRKGHAQFIDDHALIAFNDEGTIQFHKIDNAGVVVDSFQVASPSGILSDFELNNSGNISLLITKTTVPTAADNPIRIIEIDLSGTIISDETFAVSNPLIFNDLAFDNSSDAIYVSSANPISFDYSNSSIIKIESDAIAWEQLFEFSSFNEIEVLGSNYYAAGIQNDEIYRCDFEAADKFGFLLVSANKNSAPSTEVIAPHAKFELGDYSGFIGLDAQNFRRPWVEQTYGHQTQGNLIYTSSLLLAGTDSDDQIHFAANRFYSPFLSGPITNEEDYDQVEKDKWERVWKITKAQIDAHITAFETSDASYKIPEVILNWPANGDPAKGQNEQLARYKDLNGNGNYEPEQGEYPLIKGDFTLLSIYNDLPEIAAVGCILPNDKLGVQVYEYFYGFNCTSDSALSNSTFIYYEIINSTTNDYENFVVGHFLDMDVVEPFSNYFHSDPVRGITYQTYEGGEGPEQAYLVLGSSSTPDGMDNANGIGVGESPNGFGFGDGIIDNERFGMTSFISINNAGPITGSPETKEDYFNYLNAIWKDGTPLNYGGDGYAEGGITTTFHYPGDSDAIFYGTDGVDPGAIWSEATAGNPAGDRRGIAGSGSFNMNTTDTIQFDISFITGLVNDATTSHEHMLSNVDDVKTYFAANETPCEGNFDFYAPREDPFTNIGIAENNASTISLYPNPANHTINLTGIPENATVQISSISGAVVATVNNGESTLVVDIESIPAGIYIVSVLGSTNTYIKFVKE